MRRASRDYTKYLRGSEEMGGGGSGAPHEGPLHAPPPPAPPHQPAAASRFTFMALLGLGLGQVVCSVALFLYFRAQVSARLPGARGRGAPTSIRGHLQATESGSPLGFPDLREGKGTLKRERPARGQPGVGPGAVASGPRARTPPRRVRRLGSPSLVRLNFPRRDRIGRSPLLEMIARFAPPSISHSEQRVNLCPSGKKTTANTNTERFKLGIDPFPSHPPSGGFRFPGLAALHRLEVRAGRQVLCAAGRRGNDVQVARWAERHSAAREACSQDMGSARAG